MWWLQGRRGERLTQFHSHYVHIFPKLSIVQNTPQLPITSELRGGVLTRKTHRLSAVRFLRGGNDLQLSVVHAVEGGDSLGFYCEVFFTVSVKHLKVVSKHFSEHGVYPPGCFLLLNL